MEDKPRYFNACLIGVPEGKGKEKEKEKQRGGSK